ncbi:MAG: pirin family protein [Myxococcota bacterium]
MTTRRDLLASVTSAALVFPTRGWAAGTPRITHFDVRRSEDRGTGMRDWLYSRHTFSFAGYRDPAHMGFRSLRVINEDVVAGGRGFSLHPHRDMEILTYVLSGGLRHKDTLGNEGVIRPGLIQHMSAGTGIRHSEFNAAAKTDVHFLQIWLLPNRAGGAPKYDERKVPTAENQGQLTLLASGDPKADAITIHQDAHVYGSQLRKGQVLTHEAQPGRGTWIQVAEGSVELNGQRFIAGDGASTEQAGLLDIKALEPSNVVLFDLG